MSRPLQFLHSTYKEIELNSGAKSDAVIVCAKDVSTGETVLVPHIDPERLMYTVKQRLRKEFSMMKEAHHLRDLEVRQIKNVDLHKKLAKALGMHHRGYLDPKKVLNSPYSAGNDIPIDVLIKHEMNSKLQRTAERYKVGALDIETDIATGSKAILCVAYISDDHEVFLGILRSFLKGKEDIDHIESVCKEKVSEFVTTLNTAAKKQYDNCPVTKYNIEIFDTEVQMLRWTWDNVHKKKDEVMSIWNMIFDMKYMEDRLILHNVDPADVMCHPDVPKKYKVCHLNEDKTPVQKLGHHTYRWDFMNLSGYTQPIDSMCLYSRLRKVKGLKSSYALGSVAAETIGSTKMDFGDDGHYMMQTERPVEYCAYNVIDSLILTLHDKVTNDVASMFLLTQNTILPAFARQTVQLTHSFYKYLKDKNMVPGSCSGHIALVMDASSGLIKPYGTWLEKYHKYTLPKRINEGYMINLDDQIHNTGGGVLNPLLTNNTGVPLLEETDQEVDVSLAVADLDVSAEYPSVTIKMNVSKETKRSTVIAIQGMGKKAVTEFFSHYGAAYENAVYLANNFFGLPDYEEMARLASAELKGVNTDKIYPPKPKK